VSCHFCGEETGPHMLADCRPDLVEHEIGSDCTWWTSYQLFLETGDAKKYVSEITNSCYAYQNHVTLEWGLEHIHFYPNQDMVKE
jgi:hypothetical protein